MMTVAIKRRKPRRMRRARTERTDRTKSEKTSVSDRGIKEGDGTDKYGDHRRSRRFQDGRVEMALLV